MSNVSVSFQPPAAETSFGGDGTLIARYAYDAEGRRIAKEVYSSATGGTVQTLLFYYHGANVAFETDSGGTIGNRYAWTGTDQLAAYTDGSGGRHTVVTDLLGSVRATYTTGTGAGYSAQAYRPYGTLVSGAWQFTGLRYGWTGREYDAELGFYYLRARYYDPGARRFVQEDPTGYGGGGNVYAYANGSPLEGTDPDGTKFVYSMYICDNCHDLHSGLDGPMGDIFDADWGEGGGSWFFQDVVLLEMRDDLPDYSTYLSGWDNNKATFLGNDCVICKTYQQKGGDSLTSSQFNTVRGDLVDMIEDLRLGTVNGQASNLPDPGTADALSNLAGALSQGEFGVSAGITGSNVNAQTWGTVFTWLNPNFFGHSYSTQLTTLIHEGFHYVYPGNGDENWFKSIASSTVFYFLQWAQRFGH